MGELEGLDKPIRKGQIDHEITLKILEFVPNLIEKVKPSFLLSSMCMYIF